MKDLFVLTADADAEAVIRGVLSRPEALGIKDIEATVDRFVGRDSGIVRDGPAFLRAAKFKQSFEKVILVWDHHGSGWEQKKTPEEAASDVAKQLELVTWKNRSLPVVVVPEIEEWLWHGTSAIRFHFGIDEETLQQWVEEFAERWDTTPVEAKKHLPKEMFEFVRGEKMHKPKTPRHFEQIASRVSIPAWEKSASFLSFAQMLRTWFPASQKVLSV